MSSVMTSSVGTDAYVGNRMQLNNFMQGIGRVQALGYTDGQVGTKWMAKVYGEL